MSPQLRGYAPCRRFDRGVVDSESCGIPVVEGFRVTSHSAFPIARNVGQDGPDRRLDIWRVTRPVGGGLDRECHYQAVHPPSTWMMDPVTSPACEDTR